MNEDDIKFSCSDPEGLKKLEEQIDEINRGVAISLDTGCTDPTPDPSVPMPFIRDGRVYVPKTTGWESEHGITNSLFRELKPDEPSYQIVRNGIEKDRRRRERQP
jgi:hypothetical protein